MEFACMGLLVTFQITFLLTSWHNFKCTLSYVNLYQICNIPICSGKQHALASQFHYHNILSLHSNLVHPFLPKIHTLISIFAKTVIQCTVQSIRWAIHFTLPRAQTFIVDTIASWKVVCTRIILTAELRCHCRCG